jgi:hypothetical protein
VKNIFYKKWSGELALVLIYFLTATGAVMMHWLMLKNKTWCKAFLDFYLYRPANGKGNADTIDTVLPAFVLGIMIGLIGKQWPLKNVVYAVILNSIGIVILLPVYTYIIGRDLIWWWPQTNIEVCFLSIPALLEALLVVGFFTYAGRCLKWSAK